MAIQVDVVEERLKSSLCQLHVECGVLERMVYKNKNQHRRCSYFQYLLKVRRDLKLFLSIHIEDLLESCFNVITERRASQKVILLESLKRRKRDAGKYTFMDQLLGAARLLSQMVEPMMKTAMDISTLLARSFFMGFSLVILAMIARLRALVQQVLVDVVAVYSEVSSISQKKQSIMIAQNGIEVFREYYPSTEDDVVTLECTWETDKFVLVEKTTKCSVNHEHEDLDGLLGKKPVLYHSVKAFLGDEDLDLSEADTDFSTEEEPIQFKKRKTDTFASHLDDFGTTILPNKALDVEGSSVAASSTPSVETSSLLTPKSATRNKVAFVSVRRSEPSRPSAAPPEGSIAEGKLSENGGDRDPFFDLLTGGIVK